TFGQSALGVPGQAGIGANGIRPGSGASPGSPPAPPPGQPPPPEPPPFAVTAVKVTDNLPFVGCIPINQFTYDCSFTVNVALTHAQNGSTVTGRLIATAWRPNQSQMQVVPF